MFFFSRKALWVSLTAILSSTLLFASDSSSQDEARLELNSGISIHVPTKSIAQNIPDIPVIPAEEEMMPSESLPTEEKPVSQPRPLPPQMEPPLPTSMLNHQMDQQMKSANFEVGNFRPGWRPVPNPEKFPRNPFSGVFAVETPIAFKQEFDALAKNIIGFVEVGKNSVLIVQNRVIREGDSVKLVKEKEKGISIGSEQQGNAETSAPVAIFAGVDKKKEVAKFMLGDTEVHVPIPSTRKKIADANGEVNRIEGLATATFIGEKGYFVVASSLVPEVDSQKKIYVKTQFGTGVASVIKRDKETNLTLGRVETINMMGLFNGIQWSKTTESKEIGAATILAFDVEKIPGVQRAATYKLNRGEPNPKWVIGCPMFIDKQFLGILTGQQGKLSIVGQEKLRQLFPEAFLITSDEKQKAEGLTPSKLKTEEDDFFNPEKIVGLVYMQAAE